MPSPSGRLLERGVHVEPYLGPNGETVLVLIDHHHRKIGERLVQVGDSHLDIADEAWDEVDRLDPFYLKVV